MASRGARRQEGAIGMFFRGVREFGLLLAPGRLRLTLGMAVASLAVVGFCAGPALAKTKSFTTAGCSTWMVPAGVSRVSIQATGSAGQTVNGGEAAGGSGDVVSGTLSGVSVGQVLDVCVDYGGGSGGPSDGGAGAAPRVWRWAATSLSQRWSPAVAAAARSRLRAAAAQGCPAAARALFRIRARPRRVVAAAGRR